MVKAVEESKSIAIDSSIGRFAELAAVVDALGSRVLANPGLKKVIVLVGGVVDMGWLWREA